MKEECMKCQVNKKFNIIANSILLIVFISFFAILIITDSFPVVLLIEKKDTRLGFYDPIQEISVIQNPHHDSVFKIFATNNHELGHYIWNEKINKSSQIEWKILSENSTNFTSEYAKTNFREDFAETFAYTVECYYNPIYLEQVDSNKAEYFQRVWGDLE